MKLHTRSYTAYSIGCGVVWAVILAYVAAKAGKDTRHTFNLLGLGWGPGWLSATIARAVYPPPRSRQRADTAH